ncbi:MAG: TIGR04141 family sporadically distributed protein [Polyangiaceae bacterium]
MKKQTQVRALTIFLAKAGVRRDSVVDVSDRSAIHTRVKLGSSVIGDLYTYATVRRHPSWVQLFSNTVDPEKLGLWTSSASAVLLVQRKKRIFALTFGYGRHAIRTEAVEGTFGLRVTLNVVDEASIRSIDRKTFEGVTTHVREQASKVTSISSFGLNAERDLLRAVVGTPSETRYGQRLSGMDALSAAARVDLHELPALLDQYLAAASDTTYRKKYAWIDNIQEVRDPRVIEGLQNQLVADVAARRLARKWLAVPDLLDWEDIEGFRYGRGDRSALHQDLHFSTYLKSIRKRSALTWARMSAHRVRCFSAVTSQAAHEWPLTYCIYAEIDHAGGSYLLNGGSWFQLDTGFVKRLDKDLASIPSSSLPLLEYRDGEDEADYNKRLAASLGKACLMDAKQIPFGGGHSSVEYCDVLRSDNVLYHVKRYRGSSVLSHLFAQGVVSGLAFASDAQFRKALNKKLPPSFRLKNTARRPRISSYEIAYVVASKSASRLILPFFSRVTLRGARQQLEALGYRVTLTKVPIR